MFILLLSIFFISFTSASIYDDCSIYGNCEPVLSTSSVNYSLVNVNNSQYFQGYTPTTLKDWIQGLFDSIYVKIFDITSYVGNWSADKSSYVPYTGADKNVNLGNNNISISNFSSYQVDGINFIKYYATYQTIAIGKNAGKPLYESLFIGDSAGKDSSGYAQVEVGTQAGQGSTGEYQTALGYQAGYQNTGDYPLFMGFASGYQNKGYIVTASGVYSAMGNEGDYVTSHGYVSGYYNKGDYVTSIGYASARENLGNNVIAVGYNTAMRSKGNDTIAIGYEAGKYNNISNQFILKQSNINAIPLIQGNFLNGFVGIGTTTPTTKLDVNGTTNSTGGFSVGTNVGLTANYSIASGECFLTITGGLVTNTNCTSL